jgi:hypothetical protein
MSSTVIRFNDLFHHEHPIGRCATLASGRYISLNPMHISAGSKSKPFQLISNWSGYNLEV